MPYRRLPNTDTARLKALQIAVEKGRDLPPFNLAFSQNAFQKAQSFLTSFEKAILESKQAYDSQVDKNKEYLKTLKKAKMYISHFIQVVNMAILRGELPASERDYFKLEYGDKKTPDLHTEAEVIDWGSKIIEGEENRKSKGRSPISNPTIAVVRVRYEQYMDSYKFQKTLQKNYHRALEKLAELRPTADEIILQIWNEVEDSFAEFSDDERRKKAMEYGLHYVYRKNEISKLGTLKF
ncbi:MAG: hypothetical protein JXA77_02620 [Bacteroidales bacterium]|nr:hypothetical protein [Bacteroidales bacterium]MBN2817834.1 hypothetical protein [Bacteroidales bacterium]